MNNLKVCNLIMVTSNNNNKFYNMKQTSDTSFEICYGRVGTSGTKINKHISEWNKVKNSKVKKGYTEQPLDIEVEVNENHESTIHASFKKIKNKGISELLIKLYEYNANFIKQEYTVNVASVTQAQINTAYEILNRINDEYQKAKAHQERLGDEFNINSKFIKKMNDELLLLYRTIPRKMGNVNCYLVQPNSDVDNIAKIVEVETQTLETMKESVDALTKERKRQKAEKAKLAKVAASKKDDNTISNELELSDTEIMQIELGISLSDVDEDDIQLIKEKLGKDAYLFNRAFKVINPATDKKINKFIKANPNRKTEFLWHGSRNQNWYNIVQTGLNPAPKNVIITGKMFGMGVYFATSANKSIGYTSLSGSRWANGNGNVAYMGLYEVATGNIKHVDSWEHGYGQLNKDSVSKKWKGAHTVWAHKKQGFLYNDEIIVYSEEQMSIRYIVELRRK